MSSITIYLEGGGDGKNTKSALRLGMDAFLDPIKQLARTKSWHWRLVPCGGRQQTYDRFCTAVSNGQTGGIVVLLVDAETVVISNSPRTHLQTRDCWDLRFATDDMVSYLMVQSMETWIVADPVALAAYYGQRVPCQGVAQHRQSRERPQRRHRPRLGTCYSSHAEGRVSQDPSCQRDLAESRSKESWAAVSGVRATLQDACKYNQRSLSTDRPGHPSRRDGSARLDPLQDAG